MDYCPIEKYIPIFLVVLGFVFLIFNANLCLVITAYLKYYNRLKIYDLNKRNSYLKVNFFKKKLENFKIHFLCYKWDYTLILVCLDHGW